MFGFRDKMKIVFELLRVRLRFCHRGIVYCR
jgi:hypothetical protein